VLTYHDHYTRFDHLSWPLLRLIYVCLTLKTGTYFVLLVLMLTDYQKYKKLIFAFLILACTYESVYSFGSRIETLTILLAFVCCYHYKVEAISLKKGVSYMLGLAVLFSVIELFRASEFNLAIAQKVVAKEGGMPASEFGAVYFTSFHLYAERAHGTLPPKDWQMFFSDFISLIPFVDHIKWNPQYWYAKYYFPDAVVPPQTMGALADSAIWGGELDLLLRSLLNGGLFALLMRWFLRHREKWWVATIYCYCYATSIMVLKYSILYHLTPLVRIIIPTLLLGWVILRVERRLSSRKGQVRTGLPQGIP
jgi:hypothetical protein